MTISPTSIFEMRLWCALAGHAPDAGLATWNIGYCFSRCERCGRDIVRTGEGRWKVPHGYRIVWRPLPANAAEAPAPAEAEVAPAVEPEPLPWEEVAVETDAIHLDAEPEIAPTEQEPEPEPLPADEIAAEPEPIHFDAAPEIAAPEDEPPGAAIEPDPPAPVEAAAPLPQAAIEVEAPLRQPERARDFMDMEPEEEDWDDLAALPAPQIAAAAGPVVAAPRWLAMPD